MRSLIRFIYRVLAARSVLLLDQHLIPLVIVDSSHYSASSYGKTAATALAALYYRVSIRQHNWVLSGLLAADDSHLVRGQLSHARERTRVPTHSCIMPILHLPLGHSVALCWLFLLLLLVLYLLWPALTRWSFASRWHVSRWTRFEFLDRVWLGFLL